MTVEETEVVIGRIKNGETELFWPLVEPCERSLFAIAYSFLRDGDEAAEVVQETMLKALERLDQLKEGRCFRSWLIRIAINETHKWMQKERKEAQHSANMPEDMPEDAGEFALYDYVDWQNAPSTLLERKEFWEVVYEALQLLSPKSREVFVLRDIQDLTVPETASVLRISNAKVSLRLHRARLRMREILEPVLRQPASHKQVS